MWGQPSYIYAITDWEQESARKLKMMTTCIFKIRNAITAFTKAREDVGFDFTFGKKGVTDTQDWIRNGPHHSTVIKNVIGRMLNGMNFLSEIYGNNTEGKKLRQKLYFSEKKKVKLEKKSLFFSDGHDAYGDRLHGKTRLPNLQQHHGPRRWRHFTLGLLQIPETSTDRIRKKNCPRP